MITTPRPDLLTLIPIYLWHNNEPHRYYHYSIRVLSNRTLIAAKKVLVYPILEYYAYLTIREINRNIERSVNTIQKIK